MIQEKTLVQSIGVLAAVACFMPLVVLPSSFIFPFIVPKILLFRAVVLLMLGAYGLLLSINWQKYRPRLSGLTIAVFFFWLSFAISTFVGVDWYRSFWDNHERMLGLFTVSHYVLFFVILSAVLRTRAQWQSLMRTFMVAAGLVMLVGLIQKIDPDFLLNRGSDRVSSTLGNAIYLSGYGLFLLFLSALTYVHTATTDRVWRGLAIAGGVLGFIGIFLGGTRGTFLGLVGATGLLLELYAIFTAQKKRRYIAIGVIVAGILVGAGLFLAKDTDFVRSIPAVGRLAKIDFATIGDNARIMAWGIAWESYIEKPVFGWGPNNYYFAFNKYYSPGFLTHGYSETWFDNAHNIIMNTLATQGTFGIVIYVGVFVVAIRMLLLARNAGNLGDAEFALLTAFLVGHFIHNIFVFENPTSYLYFFFMLAYVHVRTTETETSVEKKSKIITTPALVSTALVVFFGMYIFNINPARANTAALEMIRGVYRGNGVALYDVAKSIPSPHIDDIRNDFARTTSQVVPQMLQANDGESARELIDLAITELEKNLILHPLDIRIHLMLSQLYQQRGVITQQASDIARSIELVKMTQELSPERQQLFFTLANLYTMVSQTEQSEELYLAARALDPGVNESWIQLIQFYRMTGNTTTAATITEEFLQNESTWSEKKKKEIYKTLNIAR